MKIKTSTPLKELNGDIVYPIENVQETVDGKVTVKQVKGDNPITIGHVLSNNLYYGKTDNQYLAFMLAKKFAMEEEITLKSEEVTFLKKFLNTSQFTAGVAGQIIAILEGEVTE